MNFLDAMLRQGVEIAGRFAGCKDSTDELEVIRAITTWAKDVRQGLMLPTEPASPATERVPLTAAEEQRRSFAFGNVSIDNPNVTRDLVDLIADDMAAADDMTKEISRYEGKVPRKLSEDPALLALAADYLRKAERRPPWSSSNLPGQDVARVRAVLVALDEYLEEKGR